MNWCSSSSSCFSLGTSSAAKLLSIRPPPGMHQHQNTTEIIQGYIIIQMKLIIQTREENAWELLLVKCKASGLWDFGLPGRLIQQGLPSARLKAPLSGNQALHCWRCCTGSVISWWIYWCLKQKFRPTYHYQLSVSTQTKTCRGGSLCLWNIVFSLSFFCFTFTF